MNKIDSSYLERIKFTTLEWERVNLGEIFENEGSYKFSQQTQEMIDYLKEDYRIIMWS